MSVCLLSLTLSSSNLFSFSSQYRMLINNFFVFNLQIIFTNTQNFVMRYRGGPRIKDSDVIRREWGRRSAIYLPPISNNRCYDVIGCVRQPWPRWRAGGHHQSLEGAQRGGQHPQCNQGPPMDDNSCNSLTDQGLLLWKTLYAVFFIIIANTGCLGSRLQRNRHPEQDRDVRVEDPVGQGPNHPLRRGRRPNLRSEAGNPFFVDYSMNLNNTGLYVIFKEILS